VIFIPTVYLSPSTQEFNQFVNGGTEEEYMNLIADAMIPYLEASGINYVRNSPQMTAASSIAQSNQSNVDFHLGIHSNASGGVPGSNQGTEVYYYPNSSRSQNAAEIFANNFKLIYPNPNKVRTVPTTSLGEVRRTNAPAVLIEVAYHDNLDDANWIKNNIDAIAQNLVLSLTDYFDIPCNFPNGTISQVTVNTNGGNLNIRERPDIYSTIIGSVPNGTVLNVYANLIDWLLINYNNVYGYVSSQYVK
jgi:N-acetylmuramoyl-L-alanine amidase